MDIDLEIKKILLKAVQDIKIHKIDNENSVIELDYDKYAIELMRLFRNYFTN